jgi:GTP-binding protein
LTNLYKNATFLLSVAKLEQLPPDDGYEIAFVGRSNAGKSSALNEITEQSTLARTSKTPGRTQLINLFGLDEQRRLVDLPGYGYAKVSENIKRDWQRLLSRYLHERQCLKGLVLLMDIRHPFKDTDQQLLLWAHEENLSVHVLLTKADKFNRNPAHQRLMKAKLLLGDFHPMASIQLFSVLNHVGLLEARQQMDRWLNIL